MESYKPIAPEKTRHITEEESAKLYLNFTIFQHFIRLVSTQNIKINKLGTEQKNPTEWLNMEAE